MRYKAPECLHTSRGLKGAGSSGEQRGAEVQGVQSLGL